MLKSLHVLKHTTMIYTDDKQPPVPTADNMGNWVRGPRNRDGRWVLEYENSVGGTIGYAFKTKRAGLTYRYHLTRVKSGLTFC